MTSSQTRSTSRARAVLVNRLHQQAPDAAAAFARDYAEAADPGLRPSQAEIDETDVLVIPDGHERGLSIEVISHSHRAECLGSDRDRHEISGVGRGEELRQLVVGQGGCGPELEIVHPAEPTVGQRARCSSPLLDGSGSGSKSPVGETTAWTRPETQPPSPRRSMVTAKGESLHRLTTPAKCAKACGHSGQKAAEKPQVAGDSTCSMRTW